MYSREEMLLEIYAMPIYKWLLSPSLLFFFFLLRQPRESIDIQNC